MRKKRAASAAARLALLTLSLALILPLAHSQQEATPVPQQATHSPYPANRPPLLPAPFIKLPAGCITPHGWLATQLVCMADGFTGRLPELSPWCKFEGSAWASPDGEGANGWEELPYWLKGFISLGYALGDERIIAEATKWIEATLASQEADGYFGPRANKLSHDLWPNMVMLDALRTHYEATGDQRVISLMLGYCKWLNSLPFEQLLPGSWQKLRAGDLLYTIHWLYNLTGEAWLVETARIVHERTNDWSGTVASWHGVNICQCFREPAQFYQQSGDVRYLRAATRNYDNFMGQYGQVPGGLFGADENARPGYTGPQQAAETCSMAEFMRSAQILTCITGEALWADRCEDVAFNSLPASMTPDLKALHYLTAPNMIQLDRSSKAPFLQNGGNMLAFDPREFRCCQHNVAMAWPYFSESLWAATPGNGLAAILYAPCEVRAQAGGGEVRIVEETDYPFGDTITLTLHPDAPRSFPLSLRIPGWCEAPELSLNAVAQQTEAKPGGFLTIDREWRDGDTVALRLPMKLSLRRWPTQRNAVSLQYGPLTFSLKIAEDWKPYWTEGDWTASEVFPASPWNWGLLLDAEDPLKGIEVIRSGGPLPAQPFTPEGAPVTLKARGRRIPEWVMMGGITGPLQESPAKSAEPTEEITLVPMGCGRLRISVFPTVSDAPDAHEWTGSVIAPSASHIHDSLFALMDGIDPAHSNDQGIPRFTWWDHRGGVEWVQYDFAKARKVSSCDVYWFDDAPIGGQCRTPQNWRVLYIEGGEWKEVAGATGCGVEANRFNRCEFTTVTTSALRLEVQLRDKWSGGILEWRIAE